jgi:predicted transposase YbfD/YdcC
MTTVASLCGADDWSEIVEVADALSPWLSKYVDLSNGVPSEYTLKRVMSLIPTKTIDALLRDVMDLLRDRIDGEIVSFDGKSLRGSAVKANALRAVHVLNAWSVDNGICLGQQKVDDKSNEITAMPELMASLDLKGTIVIADALNTQKATASQARRQKADYFLPVKGNHPDLMADLKLSFEEAISQGFRGMDADDYETTEKSRGRVEVRRYYSLDVEDLPILADWDGAKTAGLVIRERTIQGKTTQEQVLYLSSCDVDARLLARATRGHWTIENGLHWSLDVIFREDDHSYRDRVGAANLSAIRKFCLGVLAKDDTIKRSKSAKRLRAASDPKYREHLLKIVF